VQRQDKAEQAPSEIVEEEAAVAVLLAADLAAGITDSLSPIDGGIPAY
jgi:hypothetical protein